MILRRMGNKSKIAKEIQKHFPKHTMYIEPFFGAGGMFFNKPKVKYNIVNDFDNDVFNLFQVVTLQKDELKKQMEILPVHNAFLEHWKKHKEEESIRQALRFIFLSNFTYMGAGASMCFGTENPKSIFQKRIDKTFELIKDVQFSNKDFRDFFKQLRDKNANNGFIYCDPPYLGTDDNYSNSFNENDSKDLFDCLEKSKFKFAMSEFDHPFILEQAKERNLNVIIIGERGNLKNFRTEILVTNYQNMQQSLFA
jgi:DNA adenine methylase